MNGTKLALPSSIQWIVARRIDVRQRVVVNVRVPVQALGVARPRYDGTGAEPSAGEGVVGPRADSALMRSPEARADLSSVVGWGHARYSESIGGLHRVISLTSSLSVSAPVTIC